MKAICCNAQAPTCLKQLLICRTMHEFKCAVCSVCNFWDQMHSSLTKRCMIPQALTRPPNLGVWDARSWFITKTWRVLAASSRLYISNLNSLAKVTASIAHVINGRQHGMGVASRGSLILGFVYLRASCVISAHSCWHYVTTVGCGWRRTATERRDTSLFQ